jgi:hypothetical protein
MREFSRELLRAYVDDALSDAETARVESALRTDEALRKRLRDSIQERDRGDHSVGAIWRRDRLTCPTREQLGSYLLEVLEDGHQNYVHFHLKEIGCPGCLANLADIQEHQTGEPPHAKTRRKRYFQSSAGLLRKTN